MNQFLPTRKRNFQVALAVAWAALFPQSGAAQSLVYASTGDHGEAYFSDVATDQAEVLIVIVAEPDPDEAARVTSRTQATLALAEDLASARLNREAILRDQIRRTPSVNDARSPVSGYDTNRYYYPRYLPRNLLRTNQNIRQGPNRNTESPQTNRRPFAPVFKPVPPAIAN
ncbi:MAG: hypothetical protein AAF541_18240 [Pseudomonadota bacterium]